MLCTFQITLHKSCKIWAEILWNSSALNNTTYFLPFRIHNAYHVDNVFWILLCCIFTTTNSILVSCFGIAICSNHHLISKNMIKTPWSYPTDRLSACPNNASRASIVSFDNIWQLWSGLLSHVACQDLWDLCDLWLLTHRGAPKRFCGSERRTSVCFADYSSKRR